MAQNGVRIKLARTQLLVELMLQAQAGRSRTSMSKKSRGVGSGDCARSPLRAVSSSWQRIAPKSIVVSPESYDQRAL